MGMAKAGEKLEEHLVKEGYIKINAGERHKSDKMSLS